MGGVIIPSAKSEAPPIIAGKINQAAFLFTKVYREKIPPSPLLSALKTIHTYLIVVCKVNIQKIQERPPSIKSEEIILSPTMALNTYSGEVPISPKMIPRLMSRPVELS